MLLGNGDGTFAGPNITDLGVGYHTSAAAADLNGDGLDDFVTANDDYGTVSVLLGQRRRLPAGRRPTSPPATTPRAVAAGDVNGDGKLDLVTANARRQRRRAARQRRRHASQPAQNYATGGYPARVVLGDFTGDGKIDVATAELLDVRQPSSVLCGRGDGTFSAPVNSAAGSYPYAVAAGDFNGDGWLDVATANQLRRRRLRADQRPHLAATRRAVRQHQRRDGHRRQHRHHERDLHA